VEFVPNFDVSFLKNLAEGELEHDHGNTEEEQAEQVGDEE
jgi:hypothetical protein